MVTTLTKIVAGSILVGSLLFGNCGKRENFVENIVEKATEEITGEENAYDKAMKFAQNPRSIYTGNAVEETNYPTADDIKSMEDWDGDADIENDYLNLRPTRNDPTEIGLTEREEERKLSPRNLEVYMKRSEEGDLDIYSNIGGIERRLTTDPAMDAAPSLSPDKTKVAFNSDRNNLYAIYVMNIDGTGVNKIANIPWAGLTNEAKWSDDSKKIRYQVWVPEKYFLNKGMLEQERPGFFVTLEADIETGKITDDGKLDALSKKILEEDYKKYLEE